MDNNEISLNGSTATWTMAPTQGEVLGTYTGSFQFRCFLNPTQLLESGREYRSLLGNMGAQASETEQNVAFALSQLRYRIVKAPPFWESTKQDSAYGGDIPDLNILVLILEKALKAEEMFKENVQREREAILDRSIKSAEELLQKQQGGE